MRSQSKGKTLGNSAPLHLYTHAHIVSLKEGPLSLGQ